MITRTVEGATALVRALADARHLPARGHGLSVPGGAATCAPGRASSCVLACAPVLAAAVAQLEKFRHDHPTPLGVAAVTTAHTCYAVQLYRHGARNNVLGWALRAGVLAAGIGLAPRGDRMGVAVAGLAAATTSALAGQQRSDAMKGAPHGANLLLGAEALALLRTGISQRTWLRLPELGAVMLGHLLLTDALQR